MEKEIVIKEIEKRVNHHTNKEDIQTFHVDVVCERGFIKVTPKGNTLYCLEDIAEIVRFYQLGFWAEVYEGKIRVMIY